MEIEYVHVKWPNGDHDMVPASTAHIRAKAGDFEIVDPEPGRWRAFKQRVPLGARVGQVIEPAETPTSQPVIEPSLPGPDTTTITEPAPPGADTPEEGTE